MMMKTLEQAFNERASMIKAVEAEVRDVLGDYCSRSGFLLSGRAKDMESLRDKLETGRYKDVESIDDRVAFSIVIDTNDQEEAVRDFLNHAFVVTSIKSGNTLRDERLLDFDSTRVYCRLEDNLSVGKGLVDIEIQVRTLLQHAWSKITHPLVYKAKVYDFKAGRLAAELMAQLEAADRTFSTFTSVAQTVKEVERYDVRDSNRITAMIDTLVTSGVIPVEMRPANGRRLDENIYSAIRREKRRECSSAIEIIEKFLVEQRDAFPRSLTIFQLSIVALNDAGLLEHGKPNRLRRYYVTDELLSLFPQAKTIPNRIEIS